ncbi:MAG: hypothetical protein Q9210_006505 [Variospora velana]
MNAFGSITLSLLPRTGRVFPTSQNYHAHSLVPFYLVCLTRYARRSGFTPSDGRRSISSFSQVVFGHKCARGAVKRMVGAMREGIRSSLTPPIGAMGREGLEEKAVE